MKPLANANEKQPPGPATARRADENFNFDDLSAQDESQASREEARESREAKQQEQQVVGPAARSPSPSALSTASSASPLIRSNSSSSSSSSSSTMTGSHGLHSATGWRAAQQTGGPRRAHHLAPTSIAVAQLQQQQQRQQLALQQEKSKSSPKMSKFASGNKLAQMAATQKQASEPVANKKTKKTLEHEHGVGHHSEGKSVGYNLGKMMAYRASRFNEFWSVNKMRYMNLACLLMTLVCLFTILLFSKSGGQSPATLDTASQQHRFRQHHVYPQQQQQQQQRHRFMAASGDDEQPATTNGEDEQERPMESIDSIDRQPFVRAGANRKHALTMTSDEELATDSTTGGGGNTNSADGFNLFDETDSPAANGKRSLDDLLQDARRQLKRQQESEREAEESSPSTTTTTNAGPARATSSSSSSTTELPADDDKLQARKLAPIMDPLLSQVLGDLDGFGLFKSIKSQLIEQLNQSTTAAAAAGNGTGSGNELFAAGKPIVRRGKNGATIIMSFGGSLLDDKPQTVNGSAPGSMVANGTSTATIGQLPSLGSALERLLLPPPLAMMFGAGADGKSLPAQGFARITINSAAPTFLHSSGPFEALGQPPLSMFARSPFMPYESVPSPARVFAFGDSAPPAAASSTGGGAGGFMSMILRASSDLARQMDKQLSKTRANQTQIEAAAAAAAAGNSTKTELKPEASQQVKVVAGASNVSEHDDAEVETFDVGRMMGARLPVSPFHSLYSSARSLRPPPLIMIGSSSGGAPSDSSSPFGLMPPPPSTGSMFMLGGSSRPPLSLGSILGDVMSTMAREARGAAERRGEPELDTRAASLAPDDEDSSGASWGDEQQPASSRLRARHLELDAGESTEREDSEPSHFRRAPISSSSNSLLEHLLLNGNGPHATRRTFGTIRQTFRGPDGVTVERVFEMPPRVRQFEVQAVPTGVRSQSISSRMDESSSSSSLSSGQDRAPAFARMMRELSPQPESPFASARPLFSRGPGPLIGRLFRELESDTTNEEGDSHSDRSDAHDAPPSEREESPQQDNVELPRWRHEVKRVHIAGPRVSQQLPHHFSMPATPSRPPVPATADERPPQVSGHQKQAASGDSAAPHSSPSSPLFGFPALKPNFRSSPQVVAGVTEPLTAAASSHRQPRAFVYHSNHEMARQQQQPDQARARSTVASSEPPVKPASASMVMGRRLDDFVDQRR